MTSPADTAMRGSAPEESRGSADARPLWQVLLIRPEIMTFLLLVIGIIVASRLSPFFADLDFILSSATFYTEFALVALVMTIVIISGEIDLSPAAAMALCACVFGWSLRAGVPMVVALPGTLVVGGLLGALNGFLVLWFRLPSIILTIGTMILYRGLAQVIAGDRSIASFPSWFVGIDWESWFGIPVPVVIFCIAAVVLGLFLGITVTGRQIYQIGTSAEAARHAGIPVRLIKMGLFILLGVTSAGAGLMAASRLGSVRYDLATGGELQMILIAMLGGTYIFGGRGSIAGTFLASWLLIVIATGMTVANIPVTSQLIVMGSLLIVSIIATNFIYARTQR